MRHQSKELNLQGAFRSAKGFIFSSAAIKTYSCSSLLGLIVFGFLLAENEKNAEKDIINLLYGDNKADQQYKFPSYSSVAIEDELSTTIYNFRDNIVVIDLKGDDDRALQFSEFENPAGIDRAFDIACRVGENVPMALDTIEERYGEHMRESMEESVAYAQGFFQQYCPKGLK